MAMERLSLKLGYCGDAEGDCALEKSSCNAPDNWRSSGEMIGKVPYRAHGGICLLSETVRDKSLGRCGGAGTVAGRCAPNPESCQDKDEPWYDGVPFETSAGCTVEGTTFGKCGDRCSWSPRDCGPDEQWSFPAEGCACDAVRIGGCAPGEGSEAGDVYCSVAEAGCDGGSTWLSPLEMEAVGAECYVCMEETVPVDSEGVLVPAAAESKEDSSTASTSPAAVIGGAVGGALLVALLASLLITRHMKKQKQYKPEEGSQAPSTQAPPSDLELASHDNDQVSNLDVEEYESRDRLP